MITIAWFNHRIGRYESTTRGTWGEAIVLAARIREQPDTSDVRSWSNY